MCTDIILSYLTADKINAASAALVQCWRYAYRGLVSDEYLASLEDTHWVAFLEKSMRDKTAACIVAKKGDVIVGVSIFGKSITEKYPGDGEIICLYVLPDFIGQRVGSMLFEKAQQLLKEEGYCHCIACTFTENKKAIKFYHAHGYDMVSQTQTVTIGVQELPYVIMRKDFNYDKTHNLR